MSVVDANININIDSSTALSNLRKLEAQINSFQRTVAESNANAARSQQALNKALFDGIKTTGLFDAKIVNAQTTVSRFSDQLDRGKFSLGEYTRYAASQLPGMSKVFKKEFDTMQQVAESRVKKINTQYIALGKTVDGVSKAIAATPTGLGRGYATDLAIATQRQQLFNKMIDDGSTKLLNWGKNTQWAGRQLMVGFSIPLAALGTVAAKTFMEIDKATVALKRVYGDLNTTTTEINANVDALKALGKEYTKYGIALQETINIGARAAATGAKNEDLTAATEQTLRLATLGQIDYNQALDATISLQSAFSISSENLAEAIDYLNVVENQTILTLDDMTLAVPRVATVIKGLGGDVKDLAVFMTAMREGGVSAENGANALKSGLASLINPTKAAKQFLGELGINIEKIVQTNKGDIMGVVTTFGQALNSLGEFERQQALEKVFGKYQYARMGALFSNIAKNSSQAARAMELAKMSAQELADVANKELSTVSESTTVKFQAAMEQLKISIAPLGEAFLKGLTPIISMVTKFAEAFNNLPDGVKNAVAVITAALAGIGPIFLMSIGLVGNGIANLIKGMQFFRRNLARLRGDGEAFNYVANAELEATAATNSLNSAGTILNGTLQLQRRAVTVLTKEYERFAIAAGIAGGAMRGVGDAPMPGGRGGMRTPVRRNQGGTIPGSGNTDTVPAMLTPGEFVINKKATRENLPLLRAINDGSVSGYNVGGIVAAMKRFSGRKTQFAHATESRIMKEKEALSLLRPAEAQFYKTNPQSVQATALSRLTLGVSDLENQALRQIVGQGLDPKIFSARVASTKQTPRLFEKLSLPKGTNVTFRKILSEEIGKIKKNPMFDDDLAKAFNKAEKRMTKELKNDLELQKKFVSSISSAREDAFTRIKFGIPEGAPRASSVADARVQAAKMGLPTEDQPFLYYHSGQRKASALVRMPDGRIVGVQTDSTRAIKMATGGAVVQYRNKGGIINGLRYAPPGGQVSQSRSFYGIPPALMTRSFARLGLTEASTVDEAISLLRPMEKSVDRKKRGNAKRIAKIDSTLEKLQQKLFQGEQGQQLSRVLLEPLERRINLPGATSHYGEVSSQVQKSENNKLLARLGLLPGRGETVMWHSTGTPIVDDVLRPDINYSDQNRKNLKGVGFYGTERRDVSSSYLVSKPGEADVSPTQYAYKVRVKDFLNVDKQLSNQTTRSLKRQYDNLRAGNPNLPTFDEILTNANANAAIQGRQTAIIDDVREAIFKIGGGDAASQKMWVDMVRGTGKKGIRHTGGGYAGKGGDKYHTVTIAYDPVPIKRTLTTQQEQDLSDYIKMKQATEGNLFYKGSGLKAIDSLLPSATPEQRELLLKMRQLIEEKEALSASTSRINSQWSQSDQSNALRNANEAKIRSEFGATLNSGGIVPMKFADGNIVPGMGNKDTVPAMLTPGEFVVNKEATQSNLNLLHAINNGTIKGFNNGGDTIESSRTGYSAPLQFANQTKQMEWRTRAAESEAATKAAKRWNATGDQLTNALKKVAAHIVAPPVGPLKNWVAKNLSPDLQAVNNYMNRVKTVSKNMLKNTETLQKISKSTGLSLARVQQELTNFAKGQHPITAASARVLERVSSMDEAASRIAQSQGRKRNIFGARTETGYLAGMTKAILRERRLGGYDLYRDRGRFRYTGPTITTRRPKQTGETNRQQKMSQPVSRISSSVTGRQSTYSDVSIRARQIMQERGLTGQQGRQQALKLARQEQAAMQRQQGMGGMSRGMLGGTIGGALMMGSMVPMMSAGEGGKFMGMDPMAASMGMMGLGTVVSIAPMIAPLVKAHPIIAGVTVGILALTAGFVALKKGLDNTMESAKKYADALTTTQKEQQAIADVFGTKTYAQRRKENKMSKISGLSRRELGVGKEFLKTDAGKKMQEDATFLLEKNGVGFARNLGTQLSQAVISGAMTATEAKSIGAALTESLGRQDITAGVIAQIDRILAPNGDDVTNTPIQIIGQIKASIETDEKTLAANAESSAKAYGDSWTDNVLGLGFLYSGEYDAMVEANVSYTQAVIENGKSIVSSYDDQIMAQNDLIKSLDDQIKSEKNLTKKQELETKRRFAIRQKDELQQQKDLAVRERRNLEYQTLYGQETGRAERLTGVRQLVEGMAPGLNAEELLTGVRTIAGPNAKVNSISQGGFLGKMFTQTTGQNLSTAEAQTFEYKFLVDLASGRIDPLALSILQGAEEKTPGAANRVLGTIVDLQIKGDLERANKLNMLAAQLADNPEILTIFNTEIEGMPINQVITYGDVLTKIRDLPPDIYKKIAVELAGMTIPDLDNFAKSLTDLQNLNIDVVTLIDQSGTQGILKAAKATDTLSGSLKKYSKEINSINKGPKDKKLERTFTVVNKVLNAEGVEITPEQLQNELPEFAKAAGMTEEEILALPPKTMVQAFYMRFMANDLRDKAKILKDTASKVSGQIGAALLEEANTLESAANALEGGAGATARGAEYGGAGENQTDSAGSGSGGEKKVSSIKQLLNSVKEQLKLYTNFADLMKKYKGEANKLSRSIKEAIYNNSIPDQLRKMNLNEGLITSILNQGSEEARKILNALKKNKKLREQISFGYIKGMGAQASSELIGLSRATELTTSAIAQARITNPNISSDVLNTLAQDERLSAEYADPRTTKKRKREILIDIKTKVDNEKIMQYVLDPLSYQEKQLELEKREFAVRPDIIAHQEKINLLEDQLDAINEQIDAIEKLNNKDRQTIRGLERKKEMIQRQIDAIQYQNELDQRRIDVLRREDEIRNRVANALSHEIEIMGQQEQKIRDAYDKRTQALEKIRSINEQITQQQQNQLNITRALATGDIYEATAAAQQMQQSQIGFAQQQTGQALQQGMENQIAGLRTESGLTRQQAEEQINAIKEQSYQTSLKTQLIEDAIYKRNLDILPLKDEIYKIDLSIQKVNDDIYNRETEILNIQNTRLDPVQSALNTEQKILNTKEQEFENYAAQLELDIERARIIEEQGNLAVTVNDQVGNLANTWYDVTRQIEDANKAMKFQLDNLKRPEWIKGDTSDTFASKVADYNSRRKTIIDTRNAAVAAARKRGEEEFKSLSSNIAGKYAGGYMAKKYAAGNYVLGSGGRDSIPAMLTPGEFIIRKAAVDKYGIPMLNSLNMGAFKAGSPRYNVPKTFGGVTPKFNESSNIQMDAPVYNNYSVNVNVAGTNASADEIATRAIMKIKEMQNMQIRGNRAY